MKTPPPRKLKSVQPIAESSDLDFDIPAGMKLHKVGNLVRNGGKTYQCKKVSASGAVFQNIKNVADIQHFSNCHDGTEQILSSGDDERGETNNQNTNSMAKKTNTNTEKKTGKIGFIENLLDGKLTKAEIAEQVAKEFKMKADTAKNTVNWTCSTYGTRNDGKSAKVKEVERAAKIAKVKPASKPAAKKTSAKKVASKKSPPKRKPAAKDAAPVVAPAE